jgi:prepilin-type N-terminal cleavage/methylation domain-containing protein
MKIKHKNIFLKTSATPSRNAAGFSLVEVLVSIAITGILSVLVSYALNFMLSSNQKLAKEDNRRVELNRALELIASDVRISKRVNKASSSTATNSADEAITANNAIATNPAVPTFVTTNIPVLYVEIPLATCTAMAAIPADPLDPNTPAIAAAPATDVDRVVYSVETTSKKLFRYGRIPDADGNIDCGSTIKNVPIATNIKQQTVPEAADCVTQLGAGAIRGATDAGSSGLRICVNGSQVAASIFGDFGGNKEFEAKQAVVARATTSSSPSPSPTGSPSPSPTVSPSPSPTVSPSPSPTVSPSPSPTVSPSPSPTVSPSPSPTVSPSPSPTVSPSPSPTVSPSPSPSVSPSPSPTYPPVCLEYAGKSGNCKKWSY